MGRFFFLFFFSFFSILFGTRDKIGKHSMLWCLRYATLCSSMKKLTVSSPTDSDCPWLSNQWGPFQDVQSIACMDLIFLISGLQSIHWEYHQHSRYSENFSVQSWTYFWATNGFFLVCECVSITYMRAPVYFMYV